MWAAEPWLLLRHPEDDRARCFERSRDDFGSNAQHNHTFFENVLRGQICDMNWYEGSPGYIGWEGQDQDFPLPTAPALLGFDETIDVFCTDARHRLGDRRRWYQHADNCIHGSLNILSLHGSRVPYNICRNLEWITCAINGLLPGQGVRTIKFARKPSSLDFSEDGNDKVFGECRGWRPDTIWPRDCSDDGYATDSIFFLETCLVSQLCLNGVELWALEVGQAFECEFSKERFDELEQLLLGPYT